MDGIGNCSLSLISKLDCSVRCSFRCVYSQAFWNSSLKSPTFVLAEIKECNVINLPSNSEHKVVISIGSRRFMWVSTFQNIVIWIGFPDISKNSGFLKITFQSSVVIAMLEGPNIHCCLAVHPQTISEGFESVR